jgi:hypothetical protein
VRMLSSRSIVGPEQNRRFWHGREVVREHVSWLESTLSLSRVVVMLHPTSMACLTARP